MTSSKLEANKRVVRKFIEEFLNTGKTEGLSTIIARHYEEVHNSKRLALGVEGAKNHIMGVRITYPDIHLSIENQIAEGEWVATVYTMTGTHMGEWMGMKPTHKKIKATGVNIDRVVNGKIVEHGGAANLLVPLIEAGGIIIVEE
jgi:predicted ester cyclase